mgnify:CR=1 FL=1
MLTSKSPGSRPGCIVANLPAPGTSPPFLDPGVKRRSLGMMKQRTEATQEPGVSQLAAVNPLKY